MNTVNIIFTINEPTLSDVSAFTSFGQWVFLNEREGRLLFDAICQKDSVSTVFHALAQMGKDPVIVGGWYEDGLPVPSYPLNVPEWIKAAPDITDGTDPQNITTSRPTDFSEIHGWAGWQPKQRYNAAAQQAGLTLDQQEIERLLAAVDVSDQSPLEAMDRLGVRMVQGEGDGL